VLEGSLRSVCGRRTRKRRSRRELGRETKTEPEMLPFDPRRALPQSAVAGENDLGSALRNVVSELRVGQVTKMPHFEPPTCFFELTPPSERFSGVERS
jgi:hypothetical protein